MTVTYFRFKNEILVILKRRLAAENAEKNELQERVHILQNEIIQVKSVF